MKKEIRLRFAPSPTGMMHLGNIRTALMNALFAKKGQGTFILRIEDTDPERNFDPGAKKIIEDLHWLGLSYDEGPEKGGPDAPYFQSERISIYQKVLDTFIQKQQVYRCFCSTEELEKRRARQIALKKPPRYDRACLTLGEQEIRTKLADHAPYIWRFKLNQEAAVSIYDLAHGTITFELKNFSDFPLTRSDGSFTFIFANFVDDMLMKITNVIRGEDHLTNTAYQAVLFEASGAPLPTFWHLPVLCNMQGKKLSKRDFGFSLRDLRKDGYLPEAILNYLAIIGGGSFTQEIMSFDELAQAIDFDHIKTTGQVRFDTEKLTWINTKWIDRISAEELGERCLPYLAEAYPEAKTMNPTKLNTILQILKSDFSKLTDAVPAMHFYFVKPQVTPEKLAHYENKEILSAILSEVATTTDTSEVFISKAKKLAQEHKIKIKDLFEFIRLGLMGSAQGPSIHDLLGILGADESKKRLIDFTS